MAATSDADAPTMCGALFSPGEEKMEALPKWALQPVNGTNDWYPDQMAVREWLFRTWDRISENHGFRKYDAPVIEHAVLYTFKRGGDDILKEMYSFQSEGKTICLRPEMTPSMARMALNSKDVLPLKWFCQASCWRFETVSKGRRRLHHQWNADIVGGEPVKSDVEILSMIASFFEAVGFNPSEIAIRISHRGLLQGVMEAVGVPEDLLLVAFNLVDKLEKLSPEDFRASLVEALKLDDAAIDRILEFTRIRTIADLQSMNIDTELWNKSVQNLSAIVELLGAYGIQDWIRVDMSIVRGLSYYSSCVVESVYLGGKTRNRSICGGGRYDKLMNSYDPNSNLTCVGFGMGDVVITELLTELGRLPPLGRYISYCFGATSEELYTQMVKHAKRGRDLSNNIDICTKFRMKNIVAYADKIGANTLVIFAPTEWEQGQVIVKNLREHNQVTVPVESLFASA